MRIYSVPLAIAAVLGFIAAYFIYSNNKKSRVNAIFALDWVSAATWFLGYSVMYSLHDENLVRFWAKFTYTGVVFIPVFAYHFVVRFLNLKNRKRSIRFIYITALLFLFLIYFNNNFITGFYKYFWGMHTKVGYLHNFFLIYFAIVFFGCFYNLIKFLREKREKASLEYNRIKYIFLAYSIACLGALDFITNYGIEHYPLGFLFVTLALGIVTNAIVRYRLLDINIALTRAGIFAVVYALVLGIPFIIGSVLKPYFSIITSNWWIVPIVLMAILASAGPFIYMRLQRRFESRLRAQEFKSHEALRRLSHNMLRFTNLNVLLKLMVHYLVKILKLKFAAIYLFDTQAGKYLLSSAWHSGENIELPQEFENNSYLTEHLQLKKLPVVTEELLLYASTASTPMIKKLFSTLSELKINTIIPSFLRSGLLGFLILSNRRGNVPFTQEDLNLLMVLSNEAVLAIENAQFHQKEISQLVEKSKREALADMAPGASHQFNNRLASISSSAELMLLKLENFNIESLKDEGTKVILRDVKAALEMIDNEVYKGKEITSAILKRAKAKVEFQNNIDIKSIIENAYKLVLISRTKLNINMPDFKMNVLNEIPLIFGSEALLQDCSYNLIDNAFDAMQDRIRKGSLPIINASDYKDLIEITLKQENNTLIIILKDNGTGIKKENMSKLFTPYFTTKATSDKGTGLGLYIIRDFIEMHKGAITCESEYGKGTTFTIKLPVNKK